MTGSPAAAVVVDTSAVVAVLLREPGSDALAERLESAATRLMSAATRVELGIVIEARLGPVGADLLARFIRDAEIEIVAVDTVIADRALGAWRRYGKGRHRAALNVGDCFSYALAEHTGLALMCTGADFSATDLQVIRPAYPDAGSSG